MLPAVFLVNVLNKVTGDCHIQDKKDTVNEFLNVRGIFIVYVNQY